MSGFTKKEALLKKFGLYSLYNFLIETGVVRPDLRGSDLLRRATAQTLIKHYDGTMGHLVGEKKGHLGYGLLHYSLIMINRPERILCVGSKRGFIPAMCAMACKDLKRGHIDFVDAGKDVTDAGSWGGVGFWKTVDSTKHFSVLGLNKRITTYVTTTEKFARKHKRKYEYIYIDGDHSYKGVSTDYKLFWPRLTSGGFMAFHDIGLKGLHKGEEFGVHKLWKEVKGHNKFSFTRGDNTLGIIQKS